MPIAAAMNPLKTMIKLSLQLQQGASNDGIAGAMVTALSTCTPMGMFPAAPSPIPLIPAGASGTNSLLSKVALNMQQGASNSMIAQNTAMAVSLCCPAVPPSGMTALKTLIENTVLNMQQGADNNMIAQSMANSIVVYYTACGVV